MEFAHMFLIYLVRFRWRFDKEPADHAMLIQLMLSNDLYACQENLEGDQLEKENSFWHFILGR